MENDCELKILKSGGAVLTMTITKSMEEMFKEDPFNLEMEMLQGSKSQSSDGMIEYKITIKDSDKIEAIKDFILQMIVSPSFQNLN